MFTNRLFIVATQAPTPPFAPHVRAKLIVPMLVLAGAAQTCMQAAMEVPASEICPAGHASHAAPPGNALNEPEGQAVQASGGPVKPALHWQVVVLGMGAAFRGHKHVELPAGEVWQAGHAVQGVLPSKLLLPAGHGKRPHTKTLGVGTLFWDRNTLRRTTCWRVAFGS